MKTPLHLLRGAALGGSLVTTLVAQTAPAKPAATEDATLLTPFVVATEQDSGYLSTNAATATRIAMKVQDLPFNISVLNREVLADLNVANLDELFRYINGNDNNGNPPQQNFSRMRGFQQIAGSHLRNGFRFSAMKDTFNVERVEVVRGPNSTIVGEADPGGQINMVTKQGVLSRNFGELDLQAGSYNRFRAVVDYNVAGHLGSMATALRTNAIYFDTDDFIKFAHEKTRGVSLDWVLRPTRKTQIDFNFEYTGTERIQSTSPGDRWNGAPGYFGGFYYDLRDASFRTIPSNPVRSGNVIFTTGAYVSPFYGYGDSEALSGPDSKRKTNARFYNFTLDQEITRDLFLQFAGAYSLDQDYYVAQSSSLGTYAIGYTGYTQDTTGLHYAPNGRYYTNLSWTRNQAPKFTPTTDVRLSAVYKWVTPFMKQDITAGGGYYGVDSTEGSYTETLQTAAGATMTQPVYFDALTADQLGIARWLNTAGAKWTAGNPGKGAEVNNTGYFISASGSYLQGKVRTLIGVRTDKTDRTAYSGVWADAAKTQGTYTVTADGKVISKATSPLYSISYAPTEEISLFATRGYSYKPSTATRRTLKFPIDTANPYGALLDPESGVGNEFGAKLDLGQGKFALTTSYFDIKKKNVSEFWDQAKIQAWFNDPTEQRRFYTEGVESRSRGVDVEATWNPTRQISFTGGYEYLDSQTTADPNIPTNVGVFALGYKHAAQFLGKYSFTEGGLKGFSVGSGAVYRGPLQVSNGGKNFAPFPDYLVFNPFIGYQHRLVGRTNLTVTLNITNLFDRKYMKNYARFGEPRGAVLTTGVKF